MKKPTFCPTGTRALNPPSIDSVERPSHRPHIRMARSVAAALALTAMGLAVAQTQTQTDMHGL